MCEAFVRAPGLPTGLASVYAGFAMEQDGPEGPAGETRDGVTDRMLGVVSTGDVVAPGGPVGRLRWFEELVDDGPDGPVSAGDRVVALLGRGAWPVVAATAVGVGVEELRATLREGRDVGRRHAAALGALERGLSPGDEDWPLVDNDWPLSRSDEAVLEFTRAVNGARAADEIERGESIRMVALGQAKRTITTTKFTVDEKGERKPIEVVERLEELPPDLDAQIKVMERLYPERWGKVDRQETHVSGQVEVKHSLDAKDLIDRARSRIEEAEARQLGPRAPADGDDEIVDAVVVDDEAGAA